MGTIGPDMAIVAPPTFDDGSGLGERGEHLFVQALVAQAAVEALDEYANLINTMSIDEAVVFIDGVPPTHQVPGRAPAAKRVAVNQTEYYIDNRHRTCSEYHLNFCNK
jgi:hypothetical protein